MSKLFFVAPFDPLNVSKSRFFAANKKISLILGILSDIGYDVVLVSSIFQKDSTSNFLQKSYLYKLDNGKLVNVVISKFSSFSKIDYFFKLLNLKRIINFSIQKFGAPDVVWVYNAYSFEILCIKYLKKKSVLFSVLEFEDWHFSRGIGLKSILDWTIWKTNTHLIDFSFCVNSFLENISRVNKTPCFIFPGFIEFVDNDDKTSFNIVHKPIVCGYFGGLTKDKGMVFLLRLINLSIKRNMDITWTITGEGPYSKFFEDLRANFPEKVFFFGRVDEVVLQKLIRSVNVLLNPHIPNKGIFPFKVFEYLSYEKLIISSYFDLPDTLLYLKDSIIINKLDEQLWLDQILKFHSLILDYRSKISESKGKLFIDYSHEAIKSRILDLLGKFL